MKIIILFLILLTLSEIGVCQSDTNISNVMLFSSGGSLISNSGYSGSVTIGLPFVGIVSNNTSDLNIGLYGINLPTISARLIFPNFILKFEDTIKVILYNGGNNETAWIPSMPAFGWADTSKFNDLSSNNWSLPIKAHDSMTYQFIYTPTGISDTLHLLCTFPNQSPNVNFDFTIVWDSSTHSFAGVRTIDMGKYNLYPNPTIEHITLIVPSELGQIEHMSLFNECGKELVVLPFQIDGDKIQSQITNQPNGIYFLRVEGKNLVRNYKVTLIR